MSVRPLVSPRTVLLRWYDEVDRATVRRREEEMLGKLKIAAVVLTARTWITYVQVAGAVVLLAAHELAEVAPDGSENVVKWLLWFGTVLTEAVVLVRSHTRVPKTARGLAVPEGVDLVVYAEQNGVRRLRVHDLAGRMLNAEAGPIQTAEQPGERVVVEESSGVDVRRSDPPQAPPRRRKSGD